VRTNSADEFYFQATAHGLAFRPTQHNAARLGTASERWSEVWCQAGAFNSSWAAEKDNFEWIDPQLALLAVMRTPFWLFNYKGHSIRQGGITLETADPLFIADHATGAVTPWQGVAVVGAAVQAVQSELQDTKRELAAVKAELASLRRRRLN